MKQEETEVHKRVIDDLVAWESGKNFIHFKVVSQSDDFVKSDSLLCFDVSLISLHVNIHMRGPFSCMI